MPAEPPPEPTIGSCPISLTGLNIPRMEGISPGPNPCVEKPAVGEPVSMKYEQAPQTKERTTTHKSHFNWLRNLSMGVVSHYVVHCALCGWLYVCGQLYSSL